MSVLPELLAANDRYADRFDKGDLPSPPGRRVAILTCMDARLLPSQILGLEEGDVVALSGPVPYSYGYGAPVV